MRFSRKSYVAIIASILYLIAGNLFLNTSNVHADNMDMTMQGEMQSNNCIQQCIDVYDDYNLRSRDTIKLETNKKQTISIEQIVFYQAPIHVLETKKRYHWDPREEV